MVSNLVVILENFLLDANLIILYVAIPILAPIIRFFFSQVPIS